MVLRYIGESVTDSNGLAVLPDGYTGTGSGEVDIIAKTVIDDSSLQSEPYPLWDTIWFDIATTGKKSTAWSNPDNITITTTDDGTTLSQVANYYNSTTTLTGDFCLELEVKTVNGKGRFGVYASNFSIRCYAEQNETDWTWYRFKRVSGVCTIERSTDGSTWTSITAGSNTITNEDCTFKIYNLATDRAFSYRNLKAYYI